MKRLSPKEKAKVFKEEGTEIHFGFYTYDKVIEIIDRGIPVTITCPDHGDFLQTPRKHLMGRGCRECAGNKPLTTITFIEKSNIVHNNLYEYLKVDYKNNHTIVTITCRTHGDFFQIPADHLSGAGCRECNVGCLWNTDKFILASNNIHDNFYGYLKTEYKNQRTEVTITCPIHGDFPQTPEHHLRGHGCRECGKIKQKANLLKTYGVENPFQSKEIQSVIKVTMIEKYGYKTPMESPILKKKIEQTNIERYGVSNPFESKELMEESLKNKDYVEIHKKIQETMLDKYGVACMFTTDSCREKMLLDTRNRILDSIFRSDRLGGKVVPLFTEQEYLVR